MPDIQDLRRGGFPPRTSGVESFGPNSEEQTAPSAHRTRARLIFRTVHIPHPASHFSGKKRHWLAQEPSQFPFSAPRQAAPGHGNEKIPAFRKNPEGMPRRAPYPIISDPPFPCWVYDTSAGQRAGHRNHAQQPRNRAGPERFLGLRSRRIRAGPPPLICDEHPGARPRGDGHGPLAVSGDEEPGHSGRTPRMRTECPTGNRGIVPHRTRRRERPFPGANPPAAHEESLFSSRGSGEIRSPSTLRELLGRGCAGPLARC